MKILFLFFSITFSFSIFDDDIDHVEYIKTNDMHYKRRVYGYSIVYIIRSTKATNLFTQKQFKKFLIDTLKLKNWDKKNDKRNNWERSNILILNKVTIKEREILYREYFKNIYKNHFEDFASHYRDSLFFKAYQKIEKDLVKDIKKISKKKYNYQKLNNLYKKYRDKIIKEIEKSIPNLYDYYNGRFIDS